MAMSFSCNLTYAQIDLMIDIPGFSFENLKPQGFPAYPEELRSVHVQDTALQLRYGKFVINSSNASTAPSLNSSSVPLLSKIKLQSVASAKAVSDACVLGGKPSLSTRTVSPYSLVNSISLGKRISVISANCGFSSSIRLASCLTQ